MSAKVTVAAAAALYLVATAASAGSPCDASSDQDYRECVRLVDSLRVDKSGQARVFAANGSEFTAGQALWMKGQLRRVARLCASANPGDREQAERVLAEVKDLLKSHQRNS
jgi:hypothetical protein